MASAKKIKGKPQAQPNKTKKVIKKDNKKIIFFIALSVILTIIVFYNSLQNFFATNLDDSLYVSNIDKLKNLAISDIYTMFSTVIAGNYHPLAILSLTIDFNLHGTSPFYYHFENLIFHLFNVVFVYLLLKRTDAAIIGSILFAIHPMHVESVAWISERKDVLYTFFFLASLITYLLYLKNDKKYIYLFYSVILFILSLLSKSAAVCLAPMIVLIDYYWKRKFDLKTSIEKVPYFFLSLLFGILAIVSQHSAGALNALTEFKFDFSIIDRLFLISYSIMFYLIKAVAPFYLSAIHYYPEKINGALPFEFYLAPLAIALIVFVIFKFKKIQRELIFGLMFFLISLVLVLQFIPVGYAIVAERYTYVPYIGLFIIVGKLYCDFTENKFGNYSKTRRNYIVFLISIIVIMFSYLSFERCKVWKNGTTLFDDVITKNPENGHAYWARGNGKFDMNDTKGAFDDFDLAIKHNYKFPVVYNNKANCYYMMDSIQLSIKGYDEALSVDSKYAMAYYNRATAKQKLKDYIGSIDDYKKSIENNFENMSWSYNGMGFSQLCINDFDNAIKNLSKAIELQSDYASAYFNRGTVEYSQKNYKAALNDYNFSIKYNPKFDQAFYNRGCVKVAINDVSGAYTDYSKAAELGNTKANDAIKTYCNNQVNNLNK